MAFRAEIEAASFARQVSFHVDDGPEAQKLDAEATLRRAAPDTHLYVCGPGGFMEHVLGTARRLGWPDARLHREYFAAGPVDTTADGVFEVQLARQQKRCRVPADKKAFYAATQPIRDKYGSKYTALIKQIESTT